MYFWKCWRDTRSIFLVLLGGVLAIGALGAYVALDPFGWVGGQPPLKGLPDAMHKRAVWEVTASALLATLLGTVPLAGFLLGALGVGMEFEKGTADFLLTRPRSRRYLLWVSWAVGAAEMVALVLVTHLVQFLRVGRHPLSPSGRFLWSFVSFSILALVLYSLTCLMTTLSRNSRHGLSLGVAIFTAYTGLGVWLLLWYDIRIPNVWDMVFSSSRREVMSAGFGADMLPLAWFGWLAVSLAFVWIAQWRFERAEV